MIETLRHDDKASELDILAQSTKKALSEFKKSVLEKSDGQKINLYKDNMILTPAQNHSLDRYIELVGNVVPWATLTPNP